MMELGPLAYSRAVSRMASGWRPVSGAAHSGVQPSSEARSASKCSGALVDEDVVLPFFFKQDDVHQRVDEREVAARTDGEVDVRQRCHGVRRGSTVMSFAPRFLAAVMRA